jgi:hypothetical protein
MHAPRQLDRLARASAQTGAVGRLYQPFLIDPAGRFCDIDFRKLP